MSRPPSNSQSRGWNAVLADDDLLESILTYVGPNQFRWVAAVNRRWKRMYGKIHNGQQQRTHLHHTSSSRRVMSILCTEASVGYVRPEFWPGPLAAKRGDFRMLCWLRARHWKQSRKPWYTRKVCSEAANGGHLKVLKFARAHGCDWDEEVCANAAKNGHIEVLKWARTNGCVWDYSN